MAKGRMRWDCDDSGCYKNEKMFPLSKYDDIFPGDGMGLSDVDGFVERRGHFLCFEFKEGDAEMTRGQEIAFENMTAGSDRYTVFVITHSGPPDFEERFLQVGHNGKWTSKKKCGHGGIRKLIRRWYDNANGGGEKKG